jgi:hypothetical protein
MQRGGNSPINNSKRSKDSLEDTHTLPKGFLASLSSSPNTRPFTSQGFVPKNSKLSPAVKGSQHSLRTNDIPINDRRDIRRFDFDLRSMRSIPPGARSSSQLEYEAARVFQDFEGSAQRVMTGPGKYMEAHALEIELAEILLKVLQLLLIRLCADSSCIKPEISLVSSEGAADAG